MKVFQGHAAKGLGVSDPALCDDDLFGYQPRGWVVNQTKAQCRASAFKRQRHGSDDFGLNASPARNGRIGMPAIPQDAAD